MNPLRSTMTVLRISDRTYRRNPEVDRFQVPLDELAELQMIDIPGHSHLEVLNVAFPTGDIESELWIVNGGDTGTDEFLSVYGGASIPVIPENAERAISRLRRAFPKLHPYDRKYNPEFNVSEFANRGLKAHAFLSLNFENRGMTTVREAIQPFLAAFRRLSSPDLHVFLCHASEDKTFVRQLATRLSDEGAGVWLDELEIKVGDSIVERIGKGIERASHLCLVVSHASMRKPWVAKEFSSALMRQLNDSSIMVLPVRLDDAAIPALISDIKYADCRTDIESGFLELLTAIHRSNDA